MLACPPSPGRVCLPVIRQFSELLRVLTASSATLLQKHAPLKDGALLPAFSLSLYFSISLCLHLCLSISAFLYISLSSHEAGLCSLSLSHLSPFPHPQLNSPHECCLHRCLSHPLWGPLAPTNQGLLHALYNTYSSSSTMLRESTLPSALLCK